MKIYRLSIGSQLNPGGADLTRETKKGSSSFRVEFDSENPS